MEEIRQVAFKQHGARFTLMDKVEVTGPGAHPVWKYLTGEQQFHLNINNLTCHHLETSGVTPQWNFYKYLLDHQGNIVQVWPPQTPVEVCMSHAIYSSQLKVSNCYQDIYDAVERAVHEADDELQVESPLGSHDEL